RSSPVLLRGQIPGLFSSAVLASTAAAPQWPQNLLPKNIRPRHFGQATVFRRVLQNSQTVESLATPAPQFGQLRVSAVIQSFSCSCGHRLNRSISSGPYSKLFLGL